MLGMAGKPKGKRALSEPLSLRIDPATGKRLDAVAIRRSKPGALVYRAEVARDALDEGLDLIEERERPKPTK